MDYSTCHSPSTRQVVWLFRNTATLTRGGRGKMPGLAISFNSSTPLRLASDREVGGDFSVVTGLR